MLIIFGAALPVGAGEDNRTGVWGFARGKRETKKSKSEHLQRTPQGKSGCTVLEISFFAVHAGVFCCFGARLINAAFMLDCAGKIMTANFFSNMFTILSISQIL
jgi:hypothetical protein